MKPMYIVRKGKVRGEGRYMRVSGCMCFACVAWVDDRDDASRYVSKRWPEMVAKRDGARVVKLRATQAPGPAVGDAPKGEE